MSGSIRLSFVGDYYGAKGAVGNSNSIKNSMNVGPNYVA
jgi:hypothetical protein